jgi:hypothetical protein
VKTRQAAFRHSMPMPWEQMADASAQIVEPEMPTRRAFAQAVFALESLLASLRTEGEVVANACH